MKKIFLLFPLLYSVITYAQTVTPVRDRANTGQAKRMVYQQWDDWKPTPETGFLGIPKNLQGFLYWKVLHNSYYKGPDRRPYRAEGPFMENYASLTLQQKDDQRISDSMQKVMETHAATYVSMSGGDGDIAWKMYFGKQFHTLFNEIPSRLVSIAGKHPTAASKMLANKHYKEYLEYLDITKDRVEAIHNSFIDRGERMVSYLEIQKGLQRRNEVMKQMISNYIKLTKLPTAEEVREAWKKKVIHTNDAEIVRSILVNFNF